MKLWLAGMGLLFWGPSARADDPCAESPTSEATASSPLRVLRLGGTDAASQAETKLELELRLLLVGECVVQLQIEHGDFHQLSLADQQELLSDQLPESARVVWIDASGPEIWRVMLLTGGAPRSVLRVVEGPADPETIVDLARALADTLDGMKAVHPVTTHPALQIPDPATTVEPDASPEFESEPESEPESESEVDRAWLLTTGGQHAIWSDGGPALALGASIGMQQAWGDRGELQLSLSGSRAADDRIDLAGSGLELYLWREGERPWIRPGLGAVLSGNRARLSEAPDEALTYLGLQGRIGLQLHRASAPNWTPLLSAQLGLNPLDLRVHRRSDEVLLYAPGPVTLHLQLGFSTKL